MHKNWDGKRDSKEEKYMKKQQLVRQGCQRVETNNNKSKKVEKKSRYKNKTLEREGMERKEKDIFVTVLQ